MPIIPEVGRKSKEVRIVLFVIYFILIVGGITMIYPFLLMLNGAISNGFDYEQYNPYPKWAFDEKIRYLKYLVEKYQFQFQSSPEQFDVFSSAYSTPKEISKFRDLTFAEKEAIDIWFPEVNTYETRKDQLNRLYDDYLEFMQGYDATNVMALFARYTLTDYQNFLRKKYERLYLDKNNLKRGDISSRKLYAGALDLMTTMDRQGKYDRFERVQMVQGIAPHLHEWFIDLKKNRQVSYTEFLESRLRNPDREAFLNSGTCIPVTGKRLWNREILNKGETLEDLNTKWGTEYASFNEIPFFTSEPPQNSEMRAEFETFLLKKYPLRLIEIKDSKKDDYVAFLKNRVGEDVSHYNKLCSTNYASYEAIPFPTVAPKNVFERNYWIEFTRTLTADDIIIHSAEQDYQNFLAAKYGSVEKVNGAYGMKFPSLASIQIPFREIDVVHFKRSEKTLIRRFLTFNFMEAIRYIITRGRALFNTFVLVSLTIIGTLTVNPFAAYALSRYRLKSTQKILIFLLATMAFPATVTGIPNFLLLRDLHLLNTYAALIIPGLANGFSVFLLKGFFDSLPIELYEAASIDGASEWTMFWRITMPLCKPILAVLALNAFVASYGGFMWAFLVCQNEKMWTLMVWIYDFQQTFISSPYMVMGALVIASIPTLIVFMLTQKVILRGIIIPTMK